MSGVETNRRLCGIDSSTSATSISLFIDGEYKEYTLIEMDKKKMPTMWQRLNPMIMEIIKVLDKYKPTIIYQEDSWKGRNIDGLKCLTNILGAVRSWAVQNNCEYETIFPSEWRAKLGLNKWLEERETLKAKAMDFIKDKYNIDVPTDDVSDSICIGMAGILCDRKEK